MDNSLALRETLHFTKLPELPKPAQFHYVSVYKFNTEKLPFLCLEIARLFRLFDMRAREIIGYARCKRMHTRCRWFLMLFVCF